MDNERIAILETEVRDLRSSVKELEEGRKEVVEKLDEIRGELLKYKGFVGGVMFVGSCFMALITLAKDTILKKFGS
jgi:hypothetical protein